MNLESADISAKVKVAKHRTEGRCLMFTIHGFEDFCLWMYVMIDDWWQQQTDLPKRPGPAPTTCSDSELLTMILVGECKGWHQETDLLDGWADHRDLFPQQPSLSRLNRRRRNLAGSLQGLLHFLHRQLAWANDPLLIVDSIPLAVVSRAHAAHASSDWASHQARYGYSQTKRLPFFGYWLHLLVTVGGVILDWVVVSASVSDVAATDEWLHNTPVPLAGRIAVGDKGYTSKALREALAADRGLRMVVLPKRGMKAAKTLPQRVRRRIASVRQRIETLNSQLVLQFDAERTTAHSFWGMVVRLRAKLTAHLCSVYCQWQCGAALEDALLIKHLVHAVHVN
jgi:hypothetical protein